MEKMLNIALIGNPNSGKTTLFNQLTGSVQYVGNWPGVTVAKKEGFLQNANFKAQIVDLPGIYSMSPYSPEEIVTRKCLLTDDIDIIINILDATNIERNLYLTTQILELNKPTIIALNMIDIINKKGHIIEIDNLSNLLSVPIVEISASKGIGIKNLIDNIKNIKEKKSIRNFKNIFSQEIESSIEKIEKLLKIEGSVCFENARWYAIKLLENDKIVERNCQICEKTKEKIKILKEQLYILNKQDLQILIADQRYSYIEKLRSAVLKDTNQKMHIHISEKIDKIVTNRFLSLPIFIILMLLIFFTTFGPFGVFLKDSLETFIKGTFSNYVENLLYLLNSPGWIQELTINGIIAGVGSVLAFLPQIAILFILLAILEDSGYMARVAFIMDGPLRKIGLSGKAFIPMLMGFGCTVPAVLGTKILEKESDRKLTIMLTPFMSCSAKMPVYIMFVSAFFKSQQAVMIASLYFFGIMLGIFTALIFKKALFKGTESPFLMELPDYRLPNIKNLSRHVWVRLKDFLIKAGTVLFFATIIIWLLQSFSFSGQITNSSEQSILATIGKFIAPIFIPCGFGNWQSAVSLLCGLVAKESVVSTMAVLFASGNTFSAALIEHFSPLAALSFLVFVLLYSPCIAALSAIFKEMRNIKYFVFFIFYQQFIAWFFSALIFWFGNTLSPFISPEFIVPTFIFFMIFILFVLNITIKKKINRKNGINSSCRGCHKQCPHNQKG